MSKKRIVIGGAVALALLVVLGSVILDMNRAANSPERLISLGEKYLLEMDYEQALVQFLKVIEIDTMNPRGYTGAAEAYIGMGQSEMAKAVLEQGKEATGGDKSILNMMDELVSYTSPATPEPTIIPTPESSAAPEHESNSAPYPVLVTVSITNPKSGEYYDDSIFTIYARYEGEFWSGTPEETIDEYTYENGTFSFYAILGTKIEIRAEYVSFNKQNGGSGFIVTEMNQHEEVYMWNDDNGAGFGPKSVFDEEGLF